MHKAVLTAALLLAASPAGAQSVVADPSQIATLMRGAGYKAELTTDPTGDPAIKSASAGSDFWVLFYNCTNHAACKTIEFHVSFAMKTKPALAEINGWNRKARFARAYTDDVGDPVLQMDVNLDKGGMAPALLKDNLEVWTSLVAQFQKHIGWQ